jgi:hypothetical protein
MQHGKATWKMDMQHGDIDIKHRLEAWTCSIGELKRSMDMQDGKTAWDM